MKFRIFVPIFHENAFPAPLLIHIKNRPYAKFAFAGKEPGSTERKTGVNTPVNEDLSTALTPLFSAQVEFRRGSIPIAIQGGGV
jgi:hypothetical protein